MTNQEKGTSLVLATAFISGLAIFINKFGIKGMDPYFYTFAKNIIAGALLLSILLLAKHWPSLKKLDKADKWRLLLISIIGGAVPFLLFFKGLTMTTALKAGFIHKTLFIYVGILAAIFLKEKINKSMLFGFISLLAGSILFLKITPQSLNLGDLFIFIAVLFWAVEIAISKKTLQKVSGTLVATARMLGGSVFILLFLLFTGRAALFAGIDWTMLLWMAIGGVLLTGYTITFYNGLQKIKASVATSILTLGMAVTALLSALFLDKSLNAQQLLGILLMIVGVIFVSKIVRRFIKSIIFRKAKLNAST
jgi:drug/metabolite transporter (DMT)-like permease